MLTKGTLLSMHCDVYKFAKKDQLYVYIARPDYPNDVDEVKDWLAILPENFRQQMGIASFVMHLDLANRVKLARVDIHQVKEKLTQQGYFIQMPPDPYAGAGQFEPDYINKLG